MTVHPRPKRLAVTIAATVALLTPASLVLTATPALAADQITNGDFSNGTVGWTIYPGPTVQDGAGCNAVPAGGAAYSAAIQQEIPLVQGEQYKLTFRARSTPPTQGLVRVIVQGGQDVNYKQFLPAQKPAFGAEFAPYEFYFTADQDYPNAQLALQQDVVNAEAYTLCVDDVVLAGGVEPPAYEPDTGPRMRVNQASYLPKGPKNATLVTQATAPLGWELRDANGKIVKSGMTAPAGLDPSAGLTVHRIDFSGMRTRGTGFTLVADGSTSHPFDIGEDVYERLRVDAKTFFYTNRSGTPIDNALAPGYGRAAGHVGVAPNTGDTAVPCQSLDDDSQKVLVAQGDEPWTCDYTSDVTGGWYDAGDHGKYVVNGGIAAAQLMQEYERSLTALTADKGALADGTLRVPEASNGVPDLLDEVRWELEWFLKMQVRPERPLAGMVFHKVADADWTGLPMDPAADPQPRVLYRPSTAATLNVAATAAQGARLFRPFDPAFAGKLLEAAKIAYAAAKATPALHAPAPNGALDPNPGSGPYNDSRVTDEFYWAAAELYLTTGEKGFENDVLASPHHTADVFTPNGFNWGDLAVIARLDLATVPSRLPGRADVRRSVLAGADEYLAAQATQPFGQAYAPEDGQYVWGSNSQILNNLQAIGTAFDISGSSKYRDGVLRSMDYLLGRNALNLSYITGYGDAYARNQHSRMYAHQVDPSLPHPPPGTVAGGPNSTAHTSGDPAFTPLYPQGCPAQFCYVDDIGSWATNEITVNWNAPMSWVASFVADQDNGTNGRQ